MNTRGLGFPSMFLAAVIVAGCGLRAQDAGWFGGGNGGSGGVNGAAGSGAEPPSWSLSDTSSDWSNTGGAGSKAPDGMCTWDEPTTVHLVLPGHRSQASAPLSRALTTANKLPDPARVRASDFLNYYRVRYDDPPADTEIGFYAGVEPGDLPTELVLQIAVQAPVKYDRPQVALVVVVDTSLSMAGEPWKRAKAAAAALAGAIQPGDSFTLVTAKRVQKSANDASAAADLADALALDAGEDLAGALDDAYQAAESAVQANGGVGRVVLVTDGAAQPTSINLDTVAIKAQRGVPLIGVGVGDAPSYQTDFLGAATANGGGANLYLDGVDEADALLRARFDELMITVATDIEVIVNLPPSLRFQTLQRPAMADSPTGLVTASLNAGRTLVLRNVLETCDTSFSTVWSLPIQIIVRHRPAGSPDIIPSPDLGSAQIIDLKHLTTPQMLKAGAITAYADALANARTPLLERAGEISTVARTDPSLVDDADLIEIEALIQADLEIIQGSIK